MNILAILLSPPVPANAGHRVRNRSILRALALEGHAVTMLAFASKDEIASPSRELAGLCREFHLVPFPAGSLLARMFAVFGTKSYGEIRFTVPEMQSLVSEKLAETDFDAILCDDCYVAGNISNRSSVPVLLNKHDITSRIVRQFGMAEHNPLLRCYTAFEAWKIQRLEARLCASAEAVAVCSERDAQLLRKLAPSGSYFVVPNVVAVEKYSVSYSNDGHSVLFVGAMDWLPNQDAVEFLVYDVLPLLRRLVPTVRVMVAGRNPPDAILRRYAAFPDVRFSGTVAEVRPLVAQAAVCVVPVRIGSGTRLKILEAAAMGKPIVSTVLGAEGLDFRHQKEILLADEPREFAEAVASLLKDPLRASALGNAARRVVEDQYSIPALRQQLRDPLAYLNGTSTEGAMRLAR